MAFRLPYGLGVAAQIPVSTDDDVVAAETNTLPGTRMLVGLEIKEVYGGILDDLAQAEVRLQAQAGLNTWPEYPQFLTLDPDGEPIIWVSYLSSPAWWVWIGGIVGGFLLLPILLILPLWIVDLIMPGFMEGLMSIVMLMAVMGMMMFLPRMLTPPEEAEERQREARHAHPAE